MNTYIFQAGGICPVNERKDLFDVMVESERALPVEEILSAAEELSQLRAFQEEWTRTLAEMLGASVTTRGWHSGVLVICKER